MKWLERVKQAFRETKIDVQDLRMYYVLRRAIAKEAKRNPEFWYDPALRSQFQMRNGRWALRFPVGSQAPEHMALLHKTHERGE